MTLRPVLPLASLNNDSQKRYIYQTSIVEYWTAYKQQRFIYVFHGSGDWEIHQVSSRFSVW